MTDTSTSFEETELTAVNQLMDRMQEKFLEATTRLTEDRLRKAIRNTNWSEHEVVDVVKKYTPQTVASDTNDLLPSFRVHRYDSLYQVPTEDRYGDNAVVYRITEQVCREIGVDPETGLGPE